MDTPVLLRKARSGDREVSFYASVLSATTTKRPGAGRWTELTVYRLPKHRDEDPATGGYAVAKVGRSVMLHRPNCGRPNSKRKLTRIANPAAVTSLAPCLQCQPPLDEPGWMEQDRFTLLQARTPADLARILLQGRPGEAPATVLTGIVAETVRQIRRADADFDQWWPGHQYKEVDPQ